MKIIWKTVIALSVIFTSASVLNAETVSRCEIVIFPAYTGNSVADVILETTANRIKDVCSASGRFIPAEYNSVQSAFRVADAKERMGLYRNVVGTLGADAYVVITLYGEGTGFRAVVEFFNVADIYRDKVFDFAVSANIAENIPVKAAKEFALRLEGFPVIARVLQKNGEGSFTISAGQWHGLKDGYYESSCGTVRIHDVTRYTSVAECNASAEDGWLIIYSYPDNKAYTATLERQLIENTVRRYGTDEILEKRRGSGQELLLGTCLVNQGASFCLPGYGSFLSVEYLGIENGVPDKTVVGLTAVLTASHLLLPSALTGFKVNFLPWEKDSDKTGDMQRLHYFLWATLPLTFSASYYSQLAYQYEVKNLLPPLFAEHDTTAVILSLFVPGGGLFYKGYRTAGWGFYAGEMALAGCAAYMYGSRNGMWCMAGFAALKAADMLAAWIFDSSYAPFRSEIASGDGGPGLSAAYLPAYDGSGEFVITVTASF